MGLLTTVTFGSTNKQGKCLLLYGDWKLSHHYAEKVLPIYSEGWWWMMEYHNGKNVCLTSLGSVIEWQHKMSSNMSVIQQIDPGF